MPNHLSHSYFPAFSTREHECRGYANLTDPIKDRMLPTIRLTRVRGAVSFDPALAEALAAAAGRPLIVDFDPVPRPERTQDDVDADRRVKEEEARANGRALRPLSDRQKARSASQRTATRQFNQEVSRVGMPADGYAAWRKLATVAPNLIPLAKIGDPAHALSFVEAVVGEGHRIAFKLDLRDHASVPSFLHVARALRPGDEAVLLLDAGYIREGLDDARYRTTGALDLIRRGLGKAKFDDLIKVSLSNSFPASLKDGQSELRILERDLHGALTRAGWDIRYGDQASIYHRMTTIIAQGWFPHVDVAHSGAWHVNRTPEKRKVTGYVEAARTLAGAPNIWDGRAAGWGSDMVERASKNVLVDEAGHNLTSPGPWIGIRASQHLSQQAARP